MKNNKDLELSLAKLCSMATYGAHVEYVPRNLWDTNIVNITHNNEQTIVNYRGIDYVVRNTSPEEYDTKSIISTWADEYNNFIQTQYNHFQTRTNGLDVNASTESFYKTMSMNTTLKEYNIANSTRGVSFNIPRWVLLTGIIPRALTEIETFKIKNIATMIPLYVTIMPDKPDIAITSNFQINLDTNELKMWAGDYKGE